LSGCADHILVNILMCP